MKKILSFISSFAICVSMFFSQSVCVNAGVGYSFDGSGEYWTEIKENADYIINDNGREYCCYFIRDEFDGLDYKMYSIADKYTYVVITADEQQYDPELMKEKYGLDYGELVFDSQRHYFIYSESEDYEKLYELPFVKKVELSRLIVTDTYRHCMDLRQEDLASKDDPWFDDNEHDMERNFFGTMIHKFTTSSDTELTDDDFSDLGADYVHVFRYKTDETEKLSYWEAYYKVNGDYSLLGRFDEYVQNIDGVISSGGLNGVLKGLGGYSGEQDVGSSFEMTEIKRPEEGHIIYGDLDGNGAVDLSDLTMLSQYLLKDIEIAEDKIKCADVNADGEVDISDLASIKQYIMKDDVKLGALS